MSEDNIAIRLKLLISELGINSSVFADKCGISRATLSQLLTGRNKKINDILISQIHKAYPDLSIMWLLFNEGSMWINASGKDDTNASTGKSQHSGDSDSEPSDSSDDLYASQPNSQDNQKNPADNLNFLGVAGNTIQNSEEKGLNYNRNTPKSSIDQELNPHLKTAALMNEIEILRSKIRKVVQITIYYDDSTFESFFPK